jgi:hypothetical protein
MSAGNFNYGDWQVIEFAFPQGLMYRLTTTSLSSKKEFLTFDFLPTGNCQPDPAVMVKEFKSYQPGFDGGMLPYEYKVAGRGSSVEIVKILMQKGDKFAFFIFKNLTMQSLLNAPADSRLIIWMPASGDGTVKRSDNIYFSMNGAIEAYNQGRKLCLANR